MGQTLRNMRGRLIIALISVILGLSTGALFVLEGLWRLGAPLLSGMPTVALSRSLISVAFFLNNSQPPFPHFYFVLLITFISLFVYILLIYISCFIRGRLWIDSRGLVFSETFGRRTFSLYFNKSHSGCASIFKK